MAKLVFTDKGHYGLLYEFAEEKTTVGRAPDNKLCFPDPALSAHHCEILANGPEIIVRDLGSRNGTFVNGVLLQKQQAQLKDGQTVRFGEVEARLELDPPFPVDDEDVASIALLEKLAEEQKKFGFNPAAQTRELPQATSGVAPASGAPAALIDYEPEPSKPKSSRIIWSIIVAVIVALALFLLMRR